MRFFLNTRRIGQDVILHSKLKEEREWIRFFVFKALKLKLENLSRIFEFDRIEINNWRGSIVRRVEQKLNLNIYCMYIRTCNKSILSQTRSNFTFLDNEALNGKLLIRVFLFIFANGIALVNFKYVWQIFKHDFLENEAPEMEKFYSLLHLGAPVFRL